jgi:2-polyprenyl-3-methyl-5-hydroxy-6-metoxy-1,4-benzoquinol methylase
MSKESGVTSINYLSKDGKQCFGFIPHYGYDNTVYTLTMLRGNNYDYGYANRKKFLEIGCGIGNVVILAQAVGYAADGLEYNPKTCKAAKLICGGTAAKIFKGDMNKFNHYGDYDVLYYYQPMVHTDDMNEFSRKLAEKMKPGACVIANGSRETFIKSPEFTRIYGDYVWQKKEK